MDDTTTISLSPETKRTLDAKRPTGMPWDDFLSTVADLLDDPADDGVPPLATIEFDHVMMGSAEPDESDRFPPAVDPATMRDFARLEQEIAESFDRIEELARQGTAKRTADEVETRFNRF